MLSPGDQVGDRYEVEALLGEGGLARVYLVRHRTLGTAHAFKLLTMNHPSLAERLMQEGRIQAALRHVNIVGVSDILMHNGQPGLLMEYVDCVPLDTWLKDEGVPPLEAALDIFAQVLAGVGAAHQNNVLHRDLKPANILLARTGAGFVAKVTDFGIAKITQGEGAWGRTRTGVTMGTPGYMAPEQSEDAAGVDQRADIFALGAILYELVTGARAFPSPSMRDVLNATATASYASPRTFNEALGPEVIDSIRIALAPDPKNRFPNVVAFAESLFADQPARLALVTAPVELPRVSTVPPRVPPPPSVPTFPLGAGELPRPTRPSAPPTTGAPRRESTVALVLVGLGGMLLVFLVAGLVLVGLRHRRLAQQAELAAVEQPVVSPDAPVVTTGPTQPSATPAGEVAAPEPTATETTAAPASNGKPVASASGTTKSVGMTTSSGPSIGTAPTSSASAPVAVQWPVENSAAEEEDEPPTATTQSAANTVDVVGVWKGERWSVTILEHNGAMISGYAYESRPGRTAVSGSYDSSTGAFVLREDGGARLVLKGTVRSKNMKGTYTLGRSTEPKPWAAHKAAD